MTFDLDVDLLADFTDDHGRLDRAINRAQGNAAGGGVGQGPVPTSRNNGAPISMTPFISPPTISSPTKPAGKP